LEIILKITFPYDKFLSVIQRLNGRKILKKVTGAEANENAA
jgi:hypothetical protein